MANYADVSSKVMGFKSLNDMQKFNEIITSDINPDTPWLNFVECTSYCDPDENCLSFCGEVRYGIAQSILDETVQKYRKPGEISLEEISSMFGVTIEIYGTEPGWEFGEHYVIENGRITVSEQFDYQEVDTEDSYDDFLDIHGDDCGVSGEDWYRCYTDGWGYVPVGMPASGEICSYPFLGKRSFLSLTE